jgi:hypothetical protein
MQLKLKRLLSYTATLALFLTLGTAQIASAITGHREFACTDGTTALSTAAGKDSKGHPQVAVTCKSGASILYLNYDGHQPTAVDATCPGDQNIGTEVDTPNAPTSKYIFYCVIINGLGDHATATRTNSTPTIKVAAATASTKCADGTEPPKKGDLTSCAVQTVSDPALNNTKCPTVSKCDLVQGYINPFINFLAALVGVAVVISIVIGGIQYSSSGGDPAKAAAAKNRIRNAIVALVAFFFLYALLNFLIPGGLL